MNHFRYLKRAALKASIISGFCIAALACTSPKSAVNAQDMGVSPFPPQASASSNVLTRPADLDPQIIEQLPDEPTHPTLRLTVDKSEIISFPRNIGSIYIPHEAHISILPDTNRRIVIVPFEMGTTFFRILDEDGEVMMQRHAIVGSPKQNYVRIRRSCSAEAIGCEPTTVYYCEDMCHQMRIQESAETMAMDAPQITDANTAAGAAANMAPAPINNEPQ